MERAFKSNCSMGGLRGGKGNLVERALDLKWLGVEASKELPPDLSERSELPGYAVSSGKETDEGLQ